MKPYFQDDGVTLYHGDYRELSNSLGRFDVIIADPPYNETSLEWDKWPARWLDAAVVNSTNLWCFGSLRMFMDRAREFAAWNFAQDIVWEKHNGSCSASDRFRRVHECVAQFYSCACKWESIYKNPVTTMDATKRTVRRKSRPPHWGDIGAGSYASEEGGPRLMRSVIAVRSMHGTAIHKTQKPEGIVRPLIEYSCPPGGRVLSPFAGSGTDLLVAKELGMQAVGVEADERHCEGAAKRLSQLLLPTQ